MQHDFVLKIELHPKQNNNNAVFSTSHFQNENDLFLWFCSVVRFRRTGESTRSQEDGDSRQQDFTDMEPDDQESGALTDAAEVPREFANPTDGTECLTLLHTHTILTHDCPLSCTLVDTFMVEDAVEAIGFGTFQWKLSILTGLSWVRMLKQWE